MEFLSLSMIIELHKDLIKRFGGLHGIRDKRLLESALAYPQLLYSIGSEHDICLLAASYCYHIVQNHPFLDGNKRTGTLTMLTFLKMNNYPIRISKNKLYKLAIDIATSRINEQEVANILKIYLLVLSV